MDKLRYIFGRTEHGYVVFSKTIFKIMKNYIFIMYPLFFCFTKADLKTKVEEVGCKKTTYEGVGGLP